MFPQYDLDRLIARANAWLTQHGMASTSLAVYKLVARLRREELHDARESSILTVPKEASVDDTPASVSSRPALRYPAEATADLPPAPRRA